MFNLNRQADNNQRQIPVGEHDYYGLLKVSQFASLQQIKKAYKKLALRMYPQKSNYEDQHNYQLVRRAYEVLSDPQTKAKYDKDGSPIYRLVENSNHFDFKNISEKSQCKPY